MRNLEKFLNKRYKLMIGVISAFFLIVSFLNANNDAITFDEVAHIPAGYSYLTEHDYRLNPEHPPLIKALSAVPLVFMNLNFDITQDFWTQEINGQWTAGRHLLHEAGNNPDMIAFWARVPIVLISWLLGLFIFKWTQEIAGTTAGLLAFTLYSFNPNILGHNHYVTTDIGIAAFITFSFYYFLKFIKNPTWKNVFIGGLFLGLLHLAKFSSVIIIPIFGLILITYPFFRKFNWQETGGNIFVVKLKSLFEYLWKGIVAFAVSMLLVWVVYALVTYDMPKENLAKTIEFYFGGTDDNFKRIATYNALNAMNESTFTRPMSEYVLGVAMVFKRVSGGNSAYYFGEVSDDAFLSYFPMVFLMKETLPFLALLLMATGVMVYQASLAIKQCRVELFKETKRRFYDYVRTMPHQYTMCLFVIFYAYLSITGNLNIGLRHLFPIFPFLFILTSVKLITFIKKYDSSYQRIFKGAMTFLVAWIIIETILAYPYYLSYFNQTAGGPKHGHRYVTDSNADWGQDLKRLDKFLEKHPEIDKIRVDYFGGDNPKNRLGEKYIQWWDSKRPIENGWYAVSTNFFQGSVHSKKSTPENSWQWALNYKPVYQVGTSILIYHITDQEE
ncbi:MAG: glycosyltransferase family 39 protein [Candidatus Moranbacteria bacterium]|nr:glycosyltransferase family 39 protein [Candidatus Moranbacteria bacterium]